MKNWKTWLLSALGVGMSVFFFAIMRPPGGQSSAPGQDMPWQVTRSEDGATIVARARDLVTCAALLQAGANKAFPELVEASLRLAAEALEYLGVAGEDTEMLVRGVRRAD